MRSKIHNWFLSLTRVEQNDYELMQRLFIEQCPVAVAMYDEKMRFLLASDQWFIDYSLKLDEVRGRSLFEIFPRTPECWNGLLQRCLKGAAEESEEEAFRLLDGSVLWKRWKVRPWFRGHEKIGGILIYSEDFSQKKSIEELLRQSQNHALERQNEIDLILAHSGATLWAINADGIFTFYKGEMENELIKSEERIGKCIFDVLGGGMIILLKV